jgi:hypothetical protein
VSAGRSDRPTDRTSGGPRATLVDGVWTYGLAAGGEARVRQSPGDPAQRHRRDLIGLGHPSVPGLTRDDPVRPDGFAI